MMKYLIKTFTALIFFVPVNINANGIMGAFRSDKIELNIDFFDNDNSLPSRLLEKRNSGGTVAQRRSTIYRATIIPGFYDISKINITDVNMNRQKCKYKNQQWKSSSLFNVRFKQKHTGVIYTYIPEPCIVTNKKGKAIIKIRVAIWVSNVIYHRTFTFGDKP